MWCFLKQSSHSYRKLSFLTDQLDRSFNYYHAVCHDGAMPIITAYGQHSDILLIFIRQDVRNTMKILVAYASTHGSTREVADFIGRVLKTYNVEVDVEDVRTIKSVNQYDAYVLGSAIEGGTWLQAMMKFFDQFGSQFAQKPMYFWITCIRALEDEGYEHALKYYFDHKTLSAFNLRSTAVFTGKLKIEAITRQEQWYLASHYDGKQTPTMFKNDFRDWEAIAVWANKMAKDLLLEPSFASAANFNA